MELDQIHALAQEAWDALTAEKLDRAREIGETLLAEQIEVGYRVMAGVASSEDDLLKAEEWLQKGLELYPEIWELHLQLATVWSEQELYDKALERLEKARELPHADQEWISMNIAVTQARKQDFDAALNTLQEIESEAFISEAFVLQLSILDGLNQHALILELAGETLEVLPQATDEKSESVMAQICTYIASAAWYEDREEGEIRHYLELAFAYERENEGAIWLLREMNPEFSDKAKGMSLLIKGTLLDEIAPEGVTVMGQYSLVADSTEEALGMIRDFDKGWLKADSIVMLENESIEAEEEDAKGIYEVSHFMEA
ncbi:MAG: hypothetical protein AAFV07_09710 [Bacteroidota bacterium]